MRYYLCYFLKVFGILGNIVSIKWYGLDCKFSEDSYFVNGVYYFIYIVYYSI